MEGSFDDPGPSVLLHVHLPLIISPFFLRLNLANDAADIRDSEDEAEEKDIYFYVRAVQLTRSLFYGTSSHPRF